MTDYTTRTLVYDYCAGCLPRDVTVHIMPSYASPSGKIILGDELVLYKYRQQQTEETDRAHLTTISVEMTPHSVPFIGNGWHILAGYEPKSKTLLITKEYQVVP